MDRRRALHAFAAASIGLFSGALAAQSATVRRIGFLAARSRSTKSHPDVYYDAFVQGMRELGYIEGRNLEIEWRFADGNYERLPALARDLVNVGVQVIVTHGTPPPVAAKKATTSIPIVAITMTDPIGSGLVASLARPGGNVTGLSNITPDLSPKQIQLLKALVPGVKRVAVLLNLGNTSSKPILENLEKAGAELGVAIVPMHAPTLDAIDVGFATMAKERIPAVIVTSDAFLVGQASNIASRGIKNKIVVLAPFPDDVATGSLLGYGPNLADIYRRGAVYVDMILRGANPRDLPIEQPSQVELGINRKTAKAIGIKIPGPLLARAERVLE